MKKTATFTFLAITAVAGSLLTGGIFLSSPLVHALGETGSSGCASITFSMDTSVSANTEVSVFSGHYTTTGLPSVTFSSLSKLYTSGDTTVRMSSGSGSGAFTVTFASAVSIAQVSVDA